MRITIDIDDATASEAPQGPNADELTDRFLGAMLQRALDQIDDGEGLWVSEAHIELLKIACLRSRTTCNCESLAKLESRHHQKLAQQL